MGSAVLAPFRASENSHRHLKLMGDLGQVWHGGYPQMSPTNTECLQSTLSVEDNLGLTSMEGLIQNSALAILITFSALLEV
ncbi:hypothetical protein MRB53_015775 [Persea americana]|uniref:Uncharacterized protein n=1 Tax=Persea americana TaxID=3435 RepID=A0ACC2M183_PERAE|nr:hypothetical protein MRB53_015775 [Persea americana]